MIKNHRLIIDSELKNDPNTPRELLTQITLHGETLEKNVKLASNSLDLSPKCTIPTFDSYKSEFLFILSTPLQEPEKTERITSLLINLETYFNMKYTKKAENPQKLNSKPEKSKIIIQKRPNTPKFIEDTEKISNYL